MLGIIVSERTVSRILRTVPRPPSQTWKPFVRNHLGQIVSVDSFSVPTIRLQVLFVFLVLERRRREVLHFNVTEHPTSAWVAQQKVEAFADRETPRYLIRDRDGVYGNSVVRYLRLRGHRMLKLDAFPERTSSGRQSPQEIGMDARLLLPFEVNHRARSATSIPLAKRCSFR